MRRVRSALSAPVFVLVLAFHVIAATDAPHDYCEKITGCWLGSRKFEVYHPDGTWSVKRNENAPEDPRGRWRVEGNRLFITAPKDGGFATATYTIISCTDHTLILEINGYREEYERYSADCQKKA